MKELRKQEEGEAYKEFMVKMEKRFKEKLEETNKVLEAAPGALSFCDLPEAKRRKVEREHQKRQKIIEEFGFSGLQ